MSETPAGLPPPYSSGNYSNPNDYSAYPSPAGFAPPPQPYEAPKGSYPAQNYGPPQGQIPGYTNQMHSATVVVNQPQVTLIQSFRETPVRTRCIHCQADIVTGVHYETGTFAWVVCCVLWWIGLGLGCCLIPFCVDSCKDVIHTCPNCHQQIARHSRM